jgi:hypothetical protein
MMNRGFLAAGALLVLANGAILANVARNRAGNPDAVVRLSEREARAFMPPEDQTELMLILRLEWQTALGPDGEDTWFDRARLEALGVTGLPADGDTTSGDRWLGGERVGYAVLELAGPAWDRWQALKQAQRDSARARRDSSLVVATPDAEAHQHGPAAPKPAGARASRLMAVDIGPDPLALRAKYPDRSRYLILPANYRADFIPPTRDSSGVVTTPSRTTGRITQILPGTLLVPEPLRDSLLGLGAGKPDSTTHYEFTMKVGKRWEAWVE